MELLNTIATITSTIILIIGVGFGLIQLRYHRASNQTNAMLELVHRFQTPEFARAMRTLFEIRNESTDITVYSVIERDPGLVYDLMATWESLGILVYRGEVSLDMVDDFFSGPIAISWEVLADYVVEERKEMQRDTMWEWFQWLAERMQERESIRPPIPAYVT